MDAAAVGRPQLDASVVTSSGPAARIESARKKKSLPNIAILSRQRSLRGLRNAKSPPLTASVDRTFNSDPSFARSNVPPLPSPGSTAAQLKLADAKRRNEEQTRNPVDLSSPTSNLQPNNNGAQAVRHSSENPNSNTNNAQILSFSQPRLVHHKISLDTQIPPSPSNASKTPRSANESPITTRTAQPASYRKHAVRPSQGELDQFDFNLTLSQRPRTASAAAAAQLSPKHESYPNLPGSLTRPRQVSDATAMWPKSPRLDDFTPPWTNAHRDQNRGSSTSAFSTVSSAVDTQRSSVFTKDGKDSTSSDATTVDLDETDDYKDDIIDMYTSKPSDYLHPNRLGTDDSGPAKEKRRSRLIAQATELTIDAEIARTSNLSETLSPALLTPMTPLSPMSPMTPSTPALDENGEVRLDNHPQHRPPPLGSTQPGFDQYGFKKASREVSIEKYDAWWTEYEKIQARRTDRWKELMLNNGLPYEDPRCFPEPSGKTRRFVQKGIPPEWRGNAWFFYAGGHEYLEKFPGRYRKLLREAQNGKLSQLDKDSIERDLHRTFPDNIHFKPDQSVANTAPNENGQDQSRIMAALRRLLSAFAVDHPKIGYCQSLNFLAGMLLLFLPEERAYWMLHIITTDILPGTHETSLEGANVDLWVLMLTIRESLPGVWQKLGVMPSESGNGNETWQPDSVRLPPISLCATSWFMSLFIGVLPTETTLRVWDMLFYDGARVLFRVALAIFRAGEKEIRAIQDSMEIFQVVQSLPRRMIRCGVLMEQAGNGKGKFAVTNTWVDKQRSVRKDFYARERGVEIARKLSKVRKTGSILEENRRSKDSTTTATTANTEDVPETPPPLGELPPLDRVPTRKRSAWNVKRNNTIRKVTHPLA